MRRIHHENARRVATWVVFAIAMLGLALPVVALAQDPVKAGPELVVSTDENADEVVRVASDPAGNFMVVWEDNGEIQGRRWLADGAELLPATRLNSEEQSAGTGGSTSTGNVGVAADAVGNFLVVYTADDTTPILDEDGVPTCDREPCLFARRQSVDGVNGPSFLIRDPTKSYYSEPRNDQVSNPEVAALGTGDFVVVWEGYDRYPYPGYPEGRGGGEGTFAARTGPTGQRKGSSFRVNSISQYYQGQYGDLSVAGDAAGNFVVAFRSEYYYYPDGTRFPGGDMRAQLFAKTGAPIGTEFGLSTNDESPGNRTDIAQAPDGTFMVVWTDGVPGGVVGRIFQSDGTPTTGDLLVSTENAGGSSIAVGDDSFVVVWQGYGQILGRRFDLQGNVLTPEFQANSSAPGYSRPDVSAAANSDFVVAWLNVDGEPRAQQFHVGSAVTKKIRVFGKSLLITNRVPDDPVRNRGTWRSSGVEIVSPGRGTFDDPRCNRDPPGTVKAVVRFQSASTGEDTGPMYLPCQNWIATGVSEVSAVPKWGYLYLDGRLEHGPCYQVRIVGRTSLLVNCRGGEAVSFPYDLVVGRSEGSVTASLELGKYQYCAELPPALGADGSNGKKFSGRNAVAPASCPEPTLGRCGDGEIGIDEVCDDGNAEADDYCSYNCKQVTTVCGDTVVDLGEACDDGNTADGDYCASDCSRETAICGDGIVGPGEGCDDGNTSWGDYCARHCGYPTAVCGDSQIGPGEACDDGNTVGGDYCSANCTTTTAICGDNQIGPGEACDDGNTVSGDYCRADCKQITAICGDGQIGPGELCDDGNTVSGDYCRADCKQITAICGDSQIGPGEVCDDGNTVSGDYCRADCKQITAVCGDSLVGPGEVCDDGNTVDGDYCSASCTAITAVCGDGQIGPGECCDDSNTTDGDDCSSTCDSGPTCRTFYTLSTSDRGWWGSLGHHDPASGVAQVSRDFIVWVNSYFTFNTSGLAGNVVRAVLRVEMARYVTGPIDLSIWDVTTPASVLETPSVSQAIYQDLESGVQYGTLQVVPADQGRVREIELNAQALADLNAALGGTWSVGLHGDPIGIRLELAFGNEPRNHELRLEIIE